MDVHCIAGTVELTREEAKEIYDTKKYVVTSSAIWQPRFLQDQNRFSFCKVASVKGIAKKGRFHKLTAKEINNILGKQFIKESN